jgi:hypothetical protein
MGFSFFKFKIKGFVEDSLNLSFYCITLLEYGSQFFPLVRLPVVIAWRYSLSSSGSRLVASARSLVKSFGCGRYGCLDFHPLDTPITSSSTCASRVVVRHVRHAPVFGRFRRTTVLTLVFTLSILAGGFDFALL